MNFFSWCPRNGILLLLSFKTFCFPTAFKAAHIKPLHKKPNMNASDPASYQPVSNLNIIGTILEKIIIHRLRDKVMLSCQISLCCNRLIELCIVPRQRPGNSPVNFFGLSETRKTSTVVALDLTAAFDTISRSRLLSRLATDFDICHNVLC